MAQDASLLEAISHKYIYDFFVNVCHENFAELDV
jgi:hypothetical protein